MGYGPYGSHDPEHAHKSNWKGWPASGSSSSSSSNYSSSQGSSGGNGSYSGGSGGGCLIIISFLAIFAFFAKSNLPSVGAITRAEIGPSSSNYFMQQRQVIASGEESTRNETRAQGEGEVREYVIEALRDECDDLRGNYELTDYRIENLNCEQDDSKYWGCFADGKGTCKPLPLQNRLATAYEHSKFNKTKSEGIGSVRKYATDSLKSECEQLKGGNFRLLDYNMEFLDCGQTENSLWSCFAVAKGTCGEEK
jgi:hypothetical protein